MSNAVGGFGSTLMWHRGGGSWEENMLGQWRWTRVDKVVQWTAQVLSLSVTVHQNSGHPILAHSLLEAPAFPH